MDSLMLLRAIIVISIAQISRAQDSCPGNADSCLQQAGINLGIGDPATFCTETPKKLDEAGFCLQSCGYDVPQLYRQTITNLMSTCSGRAGCENFVKDYEAFRTCYNSTGDLKTLVDLVIFKYNSRAKPVEDCLKLRAVRSCMKKASGKCSYIRTIFNDLSESLGKFDVALHVCGAENVYTPTKTDGCASASKNIEANCNIACNLTSASSAGEICKLLQQQSNCIYEFSRTCTDAHITHLLPRLDSYSLINQLFQCNISVDGVVVQPAIGLNCPFKKVLEGCFNIEVSDGIPLITVKKLLNGDLPKYAICSKYGARKEAIKKCAKSLWPCSIPLERMYLGKPTESEFNARIGVFPLSELGLELYFNGCNSDQSKPALVCPSPAYDSVPNTPQAFKKFTLDVKDHTPRSRA